MSTILIDFTSLVHVTPEMDELHKCPDPKHFPFVDDMVCPKCGKDHVQQRGSAYMGDDGGPKIDLVCPWDDCGHEWTNQPCKTCGDTNINPDQSKWWEALNNAEWNKSALFLIRRCSPLGDIEDLDDIQPIIFCEKPSQYTAREAPHSLWACRKSIIHRPSDDLRPWPGCLESLIIRNLCKRKCDGGSSSCDTTQEHMAECRRNATTDCTDGFFKKYDIAFALATPETAPVFDGFGIPVLTQWRKS